MRRTLFTVAYLGLAVALGMVAVAPSKAQQADEMVRFKITNPGQALYKIAIPRVLGDGQPAAVLTEVLAGDLGLSGFFKVLDPSSFVADLAKENLGIAADSWKTVGAESVIKARAVLTGSDVSVEFRLFEVIKGENAVLTKTYRAGGADTRHLAHQFAGEVVKYFTGEDSFFGTQIAFSKNSGQTKEITVMDWDGAGLHGVTSNGSQNILPSWHPSGSSLLYTSFVRESPDLWMVAAGGGKPRRISTRSGLNTGGVFAPDGGKLALTLSFEGNSEIYLLTPSGDIIKRLTNNPGIDSSPSWSPDGSQLAFVSDRHGSPQIWVMSATGGGQNKLTRKGNYNQEPAWSPRPVNGKSVIAFSGRDERGNFDIFTVDPAGGELVRLTENRGSNTHPTWAPNARAIAYKSSRGGIYAATFDGKTERAVFRGSAESPSWGPLTKK
jgi:TolB protein